MRWGASSPARRRQMVGIGAALALASAMGLAGAPGARADKPRRVVSLNLCTDQLVLQLAERARIASVSFLAADPASSAMPRAARGLTLNHGRAEEVLPLHPDLVLAAAGAAGTTVALLRRLGHRVVELPLGRDLGDVAGHVRIVARALGEERRGKALIAAFEARLAAIPKPPAGTRPVALLFAPNGFSAGAASLPEAVMMRAGFDNLARRLGMQGVGRVPIEAVVAAAPDALILGRLNVEFPSMAAMTLHHPALPRTVPARAVIGIPHSLWACATPVIAEAVERLAAWRLARHLSGTRR